MDRFSDLGQALGADPHVAIILADGTGPAYTDPTGEGLARELALAVQGPTRCTAHIAQQ